MLYSIDTVHGLSATARIIALKIAVKLVYVDGRFKNSVKTHCPRPKHSSARKHLVDLRSNTSIVREKMRSVWPRHSSIFYSLITRSYAEPNRLVVDTVRNDFHQRIFDKVIVVFFPPFCPYLHIQRPLSDGVEQKRNGGQKNTHTAYVYKKKKPKPVISPRGDTKRRRVSCSATHLHVSVRHYAEYVSEFRSPHQPPWKPVSLWRASRTPGYSVIVQGGGVRCRFFGWTLFFCCIYAERKKETAEMPKTVDGPFSTLPSCSSFGLWARRCFLSFCKHRFG